MYLKKLSILSLILLFINLLSSCSIKTTKGNGKITDKSVAIDEYNSIELIGSGELHYSQKQDENSSLKIETDENLQDKIKISVVNGKLTIKTENIKASKLVIYATSPTVSQLAISGSGNCILEGSINTDTLTLSISGAANINGNAIHGKILNSKIAGSGDMVLGGTSDRLSIEISGSAKVDVLSLLADTTNISIAGSGDVVTATQKSLIANISGSGSIRYTGNPIVKQNIAGSGKISKIE